MIARVSCSIRSSKTTGHIETPGDFRDQVSGIYDTGIDGLFGNDLRTRVRERLGREPDPGRSLIQHVISRHKEEESLRTDNNACVVP